MADYFIKISTITGPELSQARLDDFDCVILANVPDFSDATLKATQDYLRRGGGLMVFPGPRVNANFYNEQLFKKTKLLPAELAEVTLVGRANVGSSAFTAVVYDTPSRWMTWRD